VVVVVAGEVEVAGEVGSMAAVDMASLSGAATARTMMMTGMTMTAGVVVVMAQDGAATSRGSAVATF